jgi:hypothetical protein
MTNPIHQSLNILIFKDPAEATEHGFNYNARKPGASQVKPIEVQQVVVVRNGTNGGKATVDFILKDEAGQEYVFMVTHRLLQSIPG